MPADEYNKRVRHYADILNDLFDSTPHMRVDRLFEFVCSLVRAGGIEVQGWDPWYESQAVIDDLQNLGALELPAEKFPDAGRTRVRLALLSYCHITEMDFPYMLIANLLRLRIGQKYHMAPFNDLARPIGKGPHAKLLRPSPKRKIKRIKELSEQAKLPSVGNALEEIYDDTIRNAVYHSDYTLHGSEMRLRGDHRKPKGQNILTPVVQFDELEELISNAFAFYSALLALYERCRKSFTDFKNKFVPYDPHYKGIMEFVFGRDDGLIGFRVYWPNGSHSEFSRSEAGCVGQNVEFDPDGSINFFVGLYASKRGAFSPLVEFNSQPNYHPCPGTEFTPHWPDPLAPYSRP
jgi:hypothetical protein